MTNHCYINSLAQVSCQKPLCDEWFDSPYICTEAYARAQEPDTKGIIASAEARRMSRILKRTVCTAMAALNSSEVSLPDAIITGTGAGCMENTEKFLTDMCRYGENCLKPTLFMQSTHNTMSSLVAILLKCHGYNNTYSHKGISFESALLDAFLQLKSGAAGNVLLGAHDEVSPFMEGVLRHTHPEYGFVSEVSMSAVLTATASQRNIAEVTDIKLFYKPEVQELADYLNTEKDGLLLVGFNGKDGNDIAYREVLDRLTLQPTLLHYKNIFGDNYSAPALAFYAAAKILERGQVPEAMLCDDLLRATPKPESITLLNHSDGTAWSVIRLKSTR